MLMETVRERVNEVNQLILYVSRPIPFRSGLDGHLIRASMVFTFFAFSIQKWSQYTAEMLVPLISHNPVVIGQEWVRFLKRNRRLPRIRFHDLRHAHATHLLA